MIVFQVLSAIFSSISIIFCVVTFVLNRKDKSNQDTKNDSYKWGQIDAKLSSIEKSLAKIEDKIDNFDIEVDEKIKIEMQHHINEYHKKG